MVVLLLGRGQDVHASIVFQFQSIDTLHDPVPMSIPPMSMPPMSIPVLELMAEEAVAVAVELIVMDMSISILVVCEYRAWESGKEAEKEEEKKVVRTSRRVIVYPAFI